MDTFERWWAAQVDSGAAECSEGMARAVWDAAVASERERCAKIAERVGADPALNSDYYGAEAVSREIAKAVREDAP